MIHQYKLGDLCVVLDVCSGSVHAVDEVAYDMIAGFETQERETLVDALAEKYRDREDVTRSELEECYDQLLALKDAGKLFTEDTFAPMAGELKARTSGVIKALCLHVAHTCNLNCSYCFASQGKYHGDRALMSYEVGKQALDFLMDHSGTRHNLEVDFFGGEPLMNFDVVKRLVAYARSVEKERGKHFRFTLTTNGVLIDDDVIDFANREMSNVVLSLDGRKEVHDRYRATHLSHNLCAVLPLFSFRLFLRRLLRQDLRLDSRDPVFFHVQHRKPDIFPLHRWVFPCLRNIPQQIHHKTAHGVEFHILRQLVPQ